MSTPGIIDLGFSRSPHRAVLLCLPQTLKFKKVSLLGWSDGGITALIAAARYPSYVSKMVIWGSNAYVTEQDTEIYQGRSLLPALLRRVLTGHGEMKGSQQSPAL